MKSSIIVFVFCLCASSASVFAQTKTIDSLRTVAAKSPDDTSKINLLYSISRQLVIAGEYEKAFTEIDHIDSCIAKISKQKISQSKIISDKLKSETARAQNLRGVIYNRKADFKQALVYYLQALKTREEMNDIMGIAMTSNNISGLYSNLADDGNELKYMNLAIKNFELLNDKKGLSQTYYNQSFFYYRHTDYEKALETNLKAEKFADEIGDKISKTYCLLHRGSIYSQMGNMDQSTKYFLDALRLSEQTGDKVSLAYSYSHLGINSQSKGDYAKAIEYSSKSLKLENELGDKKNIGGSYKNIGLLFSELRNKKIITGDTIGAAGLLDSALLYLQRAVEINKEIGAKDVLGNAMMLYGTLLISKNDFVPAEKYLSEALKFSFETGNKKDRMEAYLAVSNLHEAKNEQADALKFHKLYVALKDSILNETNSKTINELNTRYETEKKDKQIVLLEKQEQIDKIQLTLNNELIEQQKLADIEKSQQLELVSKENEIKRLQVQQQSIEIEKQKQENDRKKNEVVLLQKESELQLSHLQQAKLIQQFTITGLIALIIFGAFTFYRYLQRKQLSEKLSTSLTELKQTQHQLIETERQREQENVRLRISRDIHDEIGSSLTKIALLSEMSVEEMDSHPAETKESLESISEYARHVNSTLGEIIWAVNPQQDTLDRALAFMRTHINRFLKGTSINFKINFPENPPSILLNPDLKRNIFLVLKESLNNSVKYSHAKNIVVDFLLNENQFEMLISDDGKGMDVEKNLAAGNGLNNMKSRMEQCDCELEINSSPGKGCEIRAWGRLLT